MDDIYVPRAWSWYDRVDRARVFERAFILVCLGYLIRKYLVLQTVDPVLFSEKAGLSYGTVKVGCWVLFGLGLGALLTTRRRWQYGFILLHTVFEFLVYFQLGLSLLPITWMQSRPTSPLTQFHDTTEVGQILLMYVGCKLIFTAYLWVMRRFRIGDLRQQRR